MKSGEMAAVISAAGESDLETAISRVSVRDQAVMGALERLVAELRAMRARTMADKIRTDVRGIPDAIGKFLEVGRELNDALGGDDDDDDLI